MTNRIIDPTSGPAEDPALRPRNLDEYVGQKAVVENLKIYIRAAKNRGEAMDHVLLAGPPGLGKTSLAHIIAEELGVEIRPTSGPVIERGGDLAGKGIGVLAVQAAADCALREGRRGTQDRRGGSHLA